MGSAYDAAHERREELKREVERIGRTARRMSAADVGAIMHAADLYAEACEAKVLEVPGG